MLTAQSKIEAEKKLKAMSIELDFEKKIKQTIKQSVSKINQITASLKNDQKAQRSFLLLVQSKIFPQIMALEKTSKNSEQLEQKMKSDKERMNKQKLYAMEDKEKLQESIQDIKNTIKKIQQTVKQSIQEQASKRQKIQDDLEKSLGQIKEKIVTFQTESVDMEKQNQEMKIKKKQIQEKMANLQVDFKRKAQQKDDEVRKQKQQLMARLQLLEVEVSEITEINKQYSKKEKGNFDNKLSLYLKTKKFSQYSTSFENSAKTIDQCKEELLKGVQRMNDAKEKVDKFQKDSQQFYNTFMVELKKKGQKETRIQTVKKQKQEVRQKIIQLQLRLKQQKSKQSS